MLQPYFRQIALCASVAAFVMLTNLGGPRLWDRDEPRNAGCAREMLERHDWVVPVFNGELRTHKPVLLYWCIMASYSVLGVSEFAARLPSALCAVGSVICTYGMGRRLFGPGAAIWSAIGLATSLMFAVAGRAATPDSLLISCSTLSLTIYVYGTFRQRSDATPDDGPPELVVANRYFPQHWPTVLAMYAVMGLGILAKGPVGLVLPTAVIGMFLLVVRLPPRGQVIESASLGDRLIPILGPFEPLHFFKTCWSMRPLTALFAAAAVALPWYWAVGLATEGEFLRSFFLEHNLGRATASMEHHSGGIFFYPATILAGFFPWSVFALPLAIDTFLQLRRKDRFHAGYLLCVCWFGVYLVLFSLARTKLPSYVTPCYPALALLTGDYFDRWTRQAAAVAGRWLMAAFACLALVGVGIATALPLLIKEVLPGEQWLGLIGLVPLAGGLVCVGLASVRSYKAAAAWFGFTATALAVLLFAFALERVDRHQSTPALWQAIRERSANPQVASYQVLEPSWVFYGGCSVREFAPSQSVAANTAAARAAQFLATTSDAFLITTEQKTRELALLLPPEVGVVAEQPYFLRKGQRLVVLGHIGRPNAASAAVANPGAMYGRLR